MKVKIRFALNNNWSALEGTIFRLVLSGIKEVSTIRLLLGIFSDDVMAKAVMHLVNNQILIADAETSRLVPTETTRAIINESENAIIEVNAEEYNNIMTNGAVTITDYNIIRNILKAMLPAVDLTFLSKELNVVIQEVN